LTDASSVFLGAILAVGTGFLLNRFDYIWKKDRFILGVNHEMDTFVKFTDELITILASGDASQDSIGMLVPNVLTRINNSRYMTARNNEWFLAINSESIRDKTENFYWDTKERLDRLAFYIQNRSDLITLRFNISNQLHQSGVVQPEDIQQQLTQRIPIELGLIDAIGDNIIKEVNDLIGYQDSAKRIKLEITQEYSIFKKFICCISDAIRCN
jgi:hypothetical protein